MKNETPKSYRVYEFSYPEEMPEFAGIVFYVGKATNLSRLDAHLREAAKGCACAKCKAIRSIWNASLTVVRRIVFESQSESEALNEERRRIIEHQSPYLTNIIRTRNYVIERMPRSTNKRTNKRKLQSSVIVDVETLQRTPRCKCGCNEVKCDYCDQWYCAVCDWKMHINMICYYISSKIQYGAF